MTQFWRGAIAALPLLIAASLAGAADRAIIVLDASGSMWGQIDGRPKLEIARDTLRGVLSSLPDGLELGLMAYGHREKDSCEDVELVVPPAAGSWDLLVNSMSSDGDASANSPIPGAALDGMLVYELLYVPAVTRLMADAQAAGCTTIGGLEMLVAQAEKQFEIWTGEAPPGGLFQQDAGQMPV